MSSGRALPVCDTVVALSNHRTRSAARVCRPSRCRRLCRHRIDGTASPSVKPVFYNNIMSASRQQTQTNHVRAACYLIVRVNFCRFAQIHNNINACTMYIYIQVLWYEHEIIHSDYLKFESNFFGGNIRGTIHILGNFQIVDPFRHVFTKKRLALKKKWRSLSYFDRLILLTYFVSAVSNF